MKIYIWGTGKIGRRVYENSNKENVEGFIETKRYKDMFLEKKVFEPCEISLEFDAIIIANNHADENYILVEKQGIDLKKIISMCTCTYIDADNQAEFAKKILSDSNYEYYIAMNNIVEKSYFYKDKEMYKQLNKRKNFEINDENDYIILRDKFEDAGTIDNYFWQDLWAARLVYKNQPSVHYDIGSRLDGFIAHVLAFDISVKMIDIREFSNQVMGLETIVDDATELKQFDDNSISSLSALCSLEHFGLGRYGDAIDPEACFKCFSNIQKKLKPGGHLYIAVPIGKEAVHFNAHRCFYAETIVENFNALNLVEFSCTAEGKLETNVNIHKYDNAIDDGNYRFGLFHFIK